MMYGPASGEVWTDGSEACRLASAYRASLGRLVGVSGWRFEVASVEGGGDWGERLLVCEEDGEEVPEFEAPRQAVFLERHGRRPGETDVLVLLPPDFALDPCDRVGLSRSAAFDLGILAARWAGGGCEPGRLALTRLACTALALGTTWAGDEAEARRCVALAAARAGRELCEEFAPGDGPEMLARTHPGLVVLCELVARTAYREGMGRAACPELIAAAAPSVLEACVEAVA